MSETPTFLASRLRAEGEKSAEFFRQLASSDWKKTIYTDGETWTLHEVLAHFVTAEISLCRLVENIAAGGPGSAEDFNIDAYNSRKVASLKEVDPQNLISLYLDNRQRTAEVVEGLAPTDLERQGRHPFLGIAPLSEIIKIIYRHNQIHQREVRAALQADQPGESG